MDDRQSLQYDEGLFLRIERWVRSKPFVVQAAAWLAAWAFFISLPVLWVYGLVSVGLDILGVFR